MTKVLVTGANGFIGRALCKLLEERGADVVRLVRTLESSPVGPVKCCDLENLATISELDLDGIDAVVHLAAHVHQMGAETDDQRYDRINHLASRELAKRAQTCGVGRFIYLSSIKVNGEATYGVPFRAADTPSPVDDYGRSKLAAERALNALTKSSRMELVIIRPPLVYGAGVKANFAALCRIVSRGIPLPLAGIHNRRSLVALPNLCDLIAHTVLRSEETQGTYLVADAVPMSTPDLCRAIAYAQGRSARLFYCPKALLKICAHLVGRKAQMERLVGDLEVDISETVANLEWEPRHTLQSTLATMSPSGM